MLDGGTGFLKAGYAGQVRSFPSAQPQRLTASSELPRFPVPLDSRPPDPAFRRARWRHRGQGHNVRRRGGGGALDAPDHLPGT